MECITKTTKIITAMKRNSFIINKISIKNNEKTHSIRIKNILTHPSFSYINYLFPFSFQNNTPFLKFTKFNRICHNLALTLSFDKTKKVMQAKILWADDEIDLLRP